MNAANLEASFVAVVDCIEKFEHRLHFEAQDNFHWQQVGSYEKRFHVIDSDDIDHEFRELCRNSLSLLDNGRHCPMVLTVIHGRQAPHEFIIAQTSEHAYVDARSSEVIFNRIIDYYNALSRGDTDRQETRIGILITRGQVSHRPSNRMKTVFLLPCSAGLPRKALFWRVISGVAGRPHAELPSSESESSRVSEYL